MRAVLFVPIILIGCVVSNRPVLNDAWKLQDCDYMLDYVSNEFQAKIDAGTGLGPASAELGWTRKAQMLLVYTRLWQTLDEAGRKKLFDEQTAWEERARRVAEEAAKEYPGGTMESFSRNTIYAEEALNRTRALRRRLPMPAAARSLEPNSRAATHAQ